MIRLAIFSICLVLNFTLGAVQVAAMNEDSVVVVNVNGSALEDVGLYDRLARMEASCVEMRVDAEARIRAVEGRQKRKDATEAEIARRIEKLCESAEKFYEKRYEELKASHDRFMVYVNVFLVILSILFAILGPFAGWFGIVKPWKTDRRLNGEWATAKERIEGLQQHAMNSVAEFQKSKAELYFQIAKTSFVQYQQSPNVDLLEVVIKDLSQAIKCNIGAMNPLGLKCTIAFLNVVVNKDPADEKLPEQIVEHREAVLKTLRTWDWGVDEDILKLAFEKSDLPAEQIRWSIDNFKKVVAKCHV